MKKLLTTLVAFAALSAPALASDPGNLDAFALAPIGNVRPHGLAYGIGYKVANVGPVRISPLVDMNTVFGNATFRFGVAATVPVAKHLDIGLAEVQRPGAPGFTRLGTSAVLGIRL